MATMLRPKASAMASSVIAVGPVAIPPTTTVPHPMKTKANVPMNSAIAFFMTRSTQNSSRDNACVLVVPQFRRRERCLFLAQSALIGAMRLGQDCGQSAHLYTNPHPCLDPRAKPEHPPHASCMLFGISFVPLTG